jgi:hypothetical protein
MKFYSLDVLKVMDMPDDPRNTGAVFYTGAAVA